MPDRGAARNHGIREARENTSALWTATTMPRRRWRKRSIVPFRKPGRKSPSVGRSTWRSADGAARELGGTQFPGPDVAVMARQIRDWFLNYTYVFFNNVWNKAHPIELLAGEGIFPEEHRYAEDMVASARMFARTEEVALVSRGLYYYVRDTGSFTYDYSVRAARDIYLDLQDILDLQKQSGRPVAECRNFCLGACFPPSSRSIGPRTGPPAREKRPGS